MILIFFVGVFIFKKEYISSPELIDQYKNIVVDPAVNADVLEEVRVIVGW